jgi:hypothetical protein
MDGSVDRRVEHFFLLGGVGKFMWYLEAAAGAF